MKEKLKNIVPFLSSNYVDNKIYTLVFVESERHELENGERDSGEWCKWQKIYCELKINETVAITFSLN